MSQKQAETARYELDADESTFTVQAFARGMLKAFGHDPTIEIREFSGEASFDPESFANASLRVVVDATSLAVAHDVKEKDRREIEQTMRDEVLEVDAYPEIVFESTRIDVTRISDDRFKAKIVGDLTLHGATRKGLWILVQVTADGDDLRATGDFTLKQTDYDIKLVSAVGGALKVKDELKFTFDVTAHRASGDA